MEKAFELAGLIKDYKDFRLGPLDFDLMKGRTMAYVGNNGAGKTTTIQMLAGLIKPDEGHIKINGEIITVEHADWKNHIGYVGDAGGFYESCTASQNLKFISQFYRNWSVEYQEELMKRLELPADKAVKKLSAGNRMKLKIVAALSHKPNLLLLDEPATGLDPVARDEFIDILFDFMLHEENSIFYSTHVISEISRLADEFTFLTDGRLVLISDKEDLLSVWGSVLVRKTFDKQNIPCIESYENDENMTKLVSHDLNKTIEHLKNNGFEIDSVNQLSIEEISLNILRRGRK